MFASHQQLGDGWLTWASHLLKGETVRLLFIKRPAVCTSGFSVNHILASQSVGIVLHNLRKVMQQRGVPGGNLPQATARSK